MSGVSDPSGKPGGGGPTEPSMEDILASIRRILNEDEAPPAAAPAAPARPQPKDVLVLDSSMMVSAPVEEAAMEPGAAEGRHDAADRRPGEAARAASEEEAEASEARLMASEPAAAAAAAVGSLIKRLASERGALVHHGGPTIEDVVREEIRPLLKAWLDANLPGLVERLVRAEIERVLGRIAP